MSSAASRFAGLAAVCLCAALTGCSLAPLSKRAPPPEAAAPGPAADPAQARGADADRGEGGAGAAGIRTASIRTGDSRRVSKRTRSEDRRERSAARSSSPSDPVMLATSTSVGSAGIQPDLRTFVGAVELIVKTLGSANAAFSTPKSMTAGGTQPIHLVLPAESIPAELRRALSPSGTKLLQRPRIGDRIEARLDGDANFQVIPMTLEEHSIEWGEETRWLWQITPLRAGMHDLNLTISVLLDVQGKPMRRTEVFHRRISVEVVPWHARAVDFAKDHWQWLWASLIVPFVGWFWGGSNRTA